VDPLRSARTTAGLLRFGVWRGEALNINDIHVSGKALVLAKPAEVNALESQLWITIPDSYREYVTKLGEGVLGGSFVRVYPPWRILKEINEWRERIRKYWFWDKVRKLLPKERALESVIVADTLNGDELVFHPSRPDRFFVLPRDSEKIYQVGPKLLDAVEWMCSSGKLTERFKERNFEPIDSRAEEHVRRPTTEEAGESLDATVNFLQKWADKQGLVKSAKQQFKKWLAQEEEPLVGIGKKKIQKEKVKANFEQQALIFQPQKYQEPRVATSLSLIDSDSGFEFGRFTLYTQLEGTMSGYGVELFERVAKGLREFLRKSK
jgi:hypothetical protein